VEHVQTFGQIEGEMSGSCCTCGRYYKCILTFTRKPEGKVCLERSRHRWEDNIRMDLREIGMD
jgi:hypothetical protein